MGERNGHDAVSRLDAQVTDNRIKTAIKANNPKAIVWLWELYGDDMMALLQGLLGSAHDAEDALQQVFVKLVQRRQKLVRAQSIRAYLLRMARNEAYDQIRQRRRQGAGAGIRDAWLCTKTEADEAMAGPLTQALTALPPEQRAVIMLKIYKGRTFKEIAELLGLSQNTAASRYRYGIHRLRALLKEWCK
jgi:RNA polymerase sigma-70 factor (ECF subfamily)